MSEFRYDISQLFEAFLKSAQYLAGLNPHQDIWEHLGKFVVTYFPARWSAFINVDRDGKFSIHHCSLPHTLIEKSMDADMARTCISDVLQTGFLATGIVHVPGPCMTVFLPVTGEGNPGEVMLIGHESVQPLPKELLNMYLAVAGLAATSSERMNNELELTGYRARLEEMVRERTAELAQAKRQNELILCSAGEGVCGLDLQGNIIFVNPSAAQLIGWEREDLIGKDAHATFHHSRPDGCPYPANECSVREALRSGSAKQISSEVFVRKDGSSFPVEFRTTPIIENEAVVGAVIIFRDITERKKTETELRRQREYLEETVQERTRQLARQVARLEEAEQRIRSLSQRLLQVQEKERREIGHALHDEVGGTITVLKLALDQVRRKLDAGSAAVLDEVSRIVGELADQVRHIAHSLRPGMLDDYGLLETVQWYSERFEERTGISIQLDRGQFFEKLPLQVETTAYRIIQEALTNAARHSGARAVFISLSCANSILSVSVKDNGRGLDQEKAPAGMGLLGMQDLAELAGGSLSIDSSPGTGTVIACELPLKEHAN